LSAFLRPDNWAATEENKKQNQGRLHVDSSFFLSVPIRAFHLTRPVGLWFPGWYTLAPMGGVLILLLVLPAAQHGSSASVNPYTKPEDAAAGAALYRKQCAGCHGLDAAGAGAGPALNTGVFKRGGADEALFATISKGVPGTSMPGFSAFTGLQVWQLVTHLRTLSAAGNAAKAIGAGADPVAGLRLFQQHCAGCHRAQGLDGGLRGPTLEGVESRRSLADLRQSILQPDAVVANEYWSVDIQTVQGERLRGIRLNEDTSSIQIRERNGRLRSILRPEIAAAELIRTSPMPSFAGKLSDNELNHILAFLSATRGSAAAR